MAKSTSTTRDPLTRQRVVEGAVAFADEFGLNALSMRALAKDLGFEVMSLYNHVKNKPDLIQAMVDHVASVAERPSVGEGNWKDAIRTHAIAMKTALQTHSWAPALWPSTMPGPERFRVMEWQLATLATADLDEETAHHLFHAITNHTVGYALQSAMMPVDDLDTIIDDVMKTLDPGEFEHVRLHIEQHMNGHHGPSFEFVLDLILQS